MSNTSHEDGPFLLSLSDFEVSIPSEIRKYLEAQYLPKYNGDANKASKHVGRILERMKIPPATTTCRLNHNNANKSELIENINQILKLQTYTVEGEVKQIFRVAPNHSFDDVVDVVACDEIKSTETLYKSAMPPVGNGEKSITKKRPNQKVIICDTFCGEAVLRGSNIFVKGVMCADKGIHKGDIVAVYANIIAKNNLVQNSCSGGNNSIPRGMDAENYTGTCVFLGMGVMMCSRSEMFGQESGLAIEMMNGLISNHGEITTAKACMPLPPLNSPILNGKMVMQNLPSILVGAALDAKPNQVIADLCSAPGGKTSHVASIIRNQGTIVAFDKSRKKVVTMKSFFKEQGATCVTPIALDSTKCLLSIDGDYQRKGVDEILRDAPISEEDGLKNIEGFFRESFDRIILDPPCSALGLRPKLSINFRKLKELSRHANYATRFVPNAVELLKSGGVLTYSTCTINSDENEKMVKFILDNYPCMKLVPISYDIGQCGLQGVGLTDEERGMVRRFDSIHELDTMGFFVAKFIKL